jgi:hypothetical protein
MKTYDFEINISMAICNIEGKTKKEAIQILKEQFLENYNIELKDDEITEL